MMSRWAIIGLLAALGTALWWYDGVAADYRLFGGTLSFALDIVASSVTALLCVMIAEAVVGGAIVAARTTQPTGFERAGTFVVAGCVAIIVVLAHFGVNVATLLATSALLTAIIGLALQPTLGALIAGFTLTADSVLKIGDAVILGTDAVTVDSIGWRSIIGTRGDGTRTVISNSRILDGTTDIVPKGASVMGETFLLAPLAQAPDTIVSLVTDVAGDLPCVDILLPVRVGPVSVDPECAQVRYRIQFWTRSHEDRQTACGQIIGRLWYVFQREGIDWPVALNHTTDYQLRRPTLAAPAWSKRLADALERSQNVGDPTADAIAEAGTLLLYGDGERLEMPDRVDGCRCLLLKGTVEAIAYEFEAATQQATPAVGRTVHRADLKALSERLAHRIGPFAEYAVHRAALADADLETITAAVAAEIEDEADRAAFVASTPPSRRELGSGLLFDLRRDATGALQASPLMRARGPVAVAAIPRSLLRG